MDVRRQFAGSEGTYVCVVPPLAYGRLLSVWFMVDVLSFTTHCISLFFSTASFDFSPPHPLGGLHTYAHVMCVSFIQAQ